jgi:hypothetical protein
MLSVKTTDIHASTNMGRRDSFLDEKLMKQSEEAFMQGFYEREKKKRK